MNPIDYILDGLEAELALERELGVRVFECDRRLLITEEIPKPIEVAPRTQVMTSHAVERKSPASDVRMVARESVSDEVFDYVFVHDRPLSPKGSEMMSKIIAALGKTAESAPIVISSPIPAAKIVVVLGGLALKRFFPNVKGAPGQWVQDPNGRDVLVTYSPEYILRFATVTPAVLKIKQDMWLSLKSVQQRVQMKG